LTLVALDVHYLKKGARAAFVTFEHWTSATPLEEGAVNVLEVSEYIPGEFYRRELPCLLAVLAKVSRTSEIIIVDGYVWLEHGKPGLGAKLFEALESKIPVVGVAKTPYAGADALEVLRGKSQTPLLVGAAGMNALEAAEKVPRMHGLHRIPTLLARVDSLCRGLAL